MSAPATVTRFAPSPTGYLHLGHAHSALFGWRAARAAGGRFLLRIEDVDLARCRPEFEAAIFEDLAWLGLEWETPVRRQSEQMDDYAGALDRLDRLGLLYPCFCTRKGIRAEIARAVRAPHGPEGPLYPGTCRDLSEDARQERMTAGTAYALRLDMAAAAARAGPLTWTDRDVGEIAADPQSLGDVVLARKEVAASYHLSVILDDAAQGITLVTRGADLFHASHIHRLLQALLDLPVPEWHHHKLIPGPDGERLAKRADAASIRAFREAGKSPAEVRALAGFAD
jgi:glutamyl-Q tRNA(Asp) synthetase